VLGAGDAMIFTSVLRLVTAWFLVRQAPTVTQLTGQVGQLGAILAAAPLAYALQEWGWTPAFAGRLVDRPGGDGRRRAAGQGLALPSRGRHQDQARRPGSHPARRVGQPRDAPGLWSHFVSQFSVTVFSLLWGYPFLVAGQGLSPAQASALLMAMTGWVVVSGLLLGWLVTRYPYYRSVIVLVVVATMALTWGLVLMRTTPAPMWMLVVLVFAMASGGPASMVGFDLARSFIPAEASGRANGLVNIGGFSASLMTMALIGLVLDAREPAGQSAYGLDDFRVAMSVQYVFWGIGAFQVVRYRRKAWSTSPASTPAPSSSSSAARRSSTPASGTARASRVTGMAPHDPRVHEDAVRELATAYGVAVDYWDWQGLHVLVAVDTMVAVLAALGVDASTEDSARAALAAIADESWRRMLPPVLVTRQGWRTTFDVHVPEGWPVDVWVELETGEHRGGVDQHDNWDPPRTVDGELVGEATFAVPGDLPLGYHWVHARSGDRQARMSLVVTPHWVGMPARLGERRVWGLATQLYSVRSAGSWGTGDLTDLTDLGVWAAVEHGADYVLVNPLHAAEPVAPMEPSPYLPTTRRFGNPMYLRPERIPELAGLTPADRASLHALHEKAGDPVADRIDRDAAWGAKRAALRKIFEVRPSAGRDLAFEGYRRREGSGLDDYATWAAIAEVHGADTLSWPAELRHPDLPAVARFREEHAEDVEFHQWLQWVLDEQLAATQLELRRVRDGSRRDDRPRGRCALERRGRVVAAGDVRRRGDRRRPARPLQPERPGLAAAAVAAGPPGRHGVRAVPAAGRCSAAQRGWSAGRPRDRAVPALVDPEGRRADRGHVRPLRPRGDDRHPRAGGPPGRRRRRRRGPGDRRAVGPHVPRRARHPRHLDPVVRDGP
jgi:MFS family permease